MGPVRDSLVADEEVKKQNQTKKSTDHLKGLESATNHVDLVLSSLLFIFFKHLYSETAREVQSEHIIKSITPLQFERVCVGKR